MILKENEIEKQKIKKTNNYKITLRTPLIIIINNIF